MGIFADEDIVDLGDGYQAGISKELTAGVQVEVQRYLLRAKAQGVSEDEANYEAYMRTVNGMIVRFITPNGELPANEVNLGRLRGSVLQRLHEEVRARLTPLDQGASTGTPTTTSEG